MNGDELYCVNCGFVDGNVHGDCSQCGLMLVVFKPVQEAITGIQKWLQEQETPCGRSQSQQR